MIEDAIFSGFISKIINDITDVSKKKIRNAVNDKNQSLESQIYNVIVDVLNEIIDDQHKKDQNKIYDMAETLLINFKNNRSDDIKIINSCFQSYELYNTDKHIEFKKSLYHKLSKEEYRELNNEITLLWREQQSNATERIEREVSRVSQKLDDVKNDRKKIVIPNFDKKFQNNKKQEYIKNWNNRLFLHQNNEGISVTLERAFIMPNFNCHTEIRLKCSNDKTLEGAIEKIFQYDESLNVLIKGVPGIGKTSIISWISNKYEEDDRVIILRFRDWEKEELENGLLKAIYNTLKCRKMDLNNKILILDGFDEIKSLNATNRLISRFFNEILDIVNIKIIVTSRLNYLDSVCFQIEFELLPFDIKKIKIFHWRITGIELNGDEIEHENLDILGIPVILYMAIMSNIDITKKATRPELYSRIFAEKGGIFDRFSYKGIAYDKGSHMLRDNENIRKYLNVLGEIAFTMFEKNKLSLSKEEYIIPKLEFQGDLVSILEFPIKYLFENTKLNIEFIHGSIYEYFVSEYIFIKLSEKIDKNILEKIANTLGKLCKENGLSNEILEFLRYRIRESNFKEKFDVLKATFQLMLKDGMTYYTKKFYKNVIRYEMNIFSNMLEIIHLWEDFSLDYDDSINVYLQYNANAKLNLSKINLSNVNLSELSIRGANLEEANLIEANIEEANLIEANLQNADLRRANLAHANLQNANLRKANLAQADLQGTDLRNANLTGANLQNTNLAGANLKNVNLQNSNLEGANLIETNLVEANLRRANLGGAHLIESNLRKINLIGANLTGANLHSADLRNANLMYANLTEANLMEANIIRVNLVRAKLVKTIFDKYQVEYLRDKYNLDM